MADVRALLKAKRQEARITHPLATYNAAGQLRCVACGTPVKLASAWEGHIGSKAHRVNVARLREEEARREEAERHARGKRKAEAAEAEDQDAGSESEEDEELAQKRRRVGDATAVKPAVTGHAPNAPAGFPADFFSDASRAPPPPSSDDSDDEGGSKPAPAGGAPAPAAVDAEWEAFQAFISAPETKETNDREKYYNATVMAEPELEPEMQGIPAQEGAEVAPPPQELSEEDKRRIKEQDERELIMDRLMDEERAQEEADAKVSVLKSRLEAMRKQREAKKGKGKAKA